MTPDDPQVHRSRGAVALSPPAIVERPRIPGASVTEGLSRTLTVCHPVWRLANGGLERQLVQTVTRLSDDRFHHVVLIAGWDESSRKLADPLPGNVTVIAEPAAASGGGWSRRLAGHLRDCRADVIHVRGFSFLLDALMARELCGDTRLAWSFHGFQDGQGIPSGLARKITREAILRCDDRWAVSERAALAVCTELNIPAACMGVIRNGVDISRFTPANEFERMQLREAMGLPLDRLIILCLGNMKPIKGQDVLLEALQHIDGVPDFRTVFVGEDGFHGKLQATAARDLKHRDVRFIDATDDPLSWYRAADLFVLPSRSEGMSNALLEAMACGLPVVATDVGGNGEVVEGERSGLLVPASSPVALATGLARLLMAPSLRRALGVAARARVVQAFQMDTMVDLLGARYRANGMSVVLNDGAACFASDASRRSIDDGHSTRRVDGFDRVHEWNHASRGTMPRAGK